MEIARRLASRVLVKKMTTEGKHRNEAYGLAKNLWVLSLDADEVVSDELRDELRNLFKKDLKYLAFTIPIKTYLGNYWIKYGGWYPAGKVRLFRKDKVRYEEVEVHPRILMDEEKRCAHLSKDIIHYSYGDFHDFFASLNNQTTLEAKKWFNEKRKINFLKMTKKFCARFLKTYFVKKGFKDGLIGFVIAYGSALYQLMSYVKYKHMLMEKKDKEGSRS